MARKGLSGGGPESATDGQPTAPVFSVVALLVLGISVAVMLAT
jgi:hypothetical protein